jgi:hypothetical protein
MPADASSPENRCASASNRRVFADSNGASISVHARTAFRSSTIAGVGSFFVRQRRAVRLVRHRVQHRRVVSRCDLPQLAGRPPGIRDVVTGKCDLNPGGQQPGAMQRIERVGQRRRDR